MIKMKKTNELESSPMIEASFRAGKGEAMIKKMASILAKRMGTDFSVSPVPFENRNFTVIRMGIGNSMVDVKYEQGSSDVIKEVDVFNEPSSVPTYSIELNSQDNVINVVNTIEEALKGVLDYD